LGIYATDADLAAIYILLLLYCQLVFSETSRARWDRKGKANRQIGEAELAKLKPEIWVITPPRLGSCFIAKSRRLDRLGASSRHDGYGSKGRGERRGEGRPRTRSGKSELERWCERWRKGIKDVAWHIAARSKGVEWWVEAASAQALNPLQHQHLGSPRPSRCSTHPQISYGEGNLKLGSPFPALSKECMRFYTLPWPAITMSTTFAPLTPRADERLHLMGFARRSSSGKLGRTIIAPLVGRSGG
jgi:hypothetical protein